MENNPLQKYFRQPKIYLSLPSQGNFYPPGVINGDPSNLAVFGMSAMDEIMFKTPDALFNGEATVAVIKSCIPGITQPWVMPQIDVDACLVAIRIATYGESLETTFQCSSCSEENKFDLNLNSTLEYFLNLQYETDVLVGPLMVKLRPLTYREITQINIETYSLRKQLYQAVDVADDQAKSAELNAIYQKIAEQTTLGFRKCIASVTSEDDTVTNENQIAEWIEHSDKEFFDKVRDHLESLSSKWTLQPQKVNCTACGHENVVTMGMDNSNFFVRA